MTFSRHYWTGDGWRSEPLTYHPLHGRLLALRQEIEDVQRLALRDDDESIMAALAQARASVNAVLIAIAIDAAAKRRK